MLLPNLAHRNLSKYSALTLSACKQSACNAGDPGSFLGSGRKAGEGIGYPLQYSWASLVAQLVKNPHAMWETWVLSLGWEDPLEKGKATQSSILAWRIPCRVHGITKSRIRLNDFHFQHSKQVLHFVYPFIHKCIVGLLPPFSLKYS